MTTKIGIASIVTAWHLSPPVNSWGIFKNVRRIAVCRPLTGPHAVCLSSKFNKKARSTCFMFVWQTTGDPMEDSCFLNTRYPILVLETFVAAGRLISTKCLIWKYDIINIRRKGWLLGRKNQASLSSKCFLCVQRWGGGGNCAYKLILVQLYISL